MTLKLVPPLKKNNTETPKKEEKPDQESKKHVDIDWSENTKIVVLAFILGFIPLFSYTMGKAQFGHEVGIHIGVGVGALCVFMTAGLLYFANFLDDTDLA